MVRILPQTPFMEYEDHRVAHIMRGFAARLLPLECEVLAFEEGYQVFKNTSIYQEFPDDKGIISKAIWYLTKQKIGVTSEKVADIDLRGEGISIGSNNPKIIKACKDLPSLLKNSKDL